MNTTIEAPDMTPASHALQEALKFIERLNDCTPDEATDLLTNSGETVEDMLRNSISDSKPSTANATNEARAQLDSILALTKALREARESDDEAAMDTARERIMEDALDISVRSDWVAPGAENFPVAEFSILLATGGPACRLIGTLDRCEPDSATMEWQDWGTPWTPVRLTQEERDACLEYAGQFCWEC